MMWQLRADHEQKQGPSDVTITQGLDVTRPITEALQLPFGMSIPGGGLMGTAPHRPGDHVGWVDAALGQLHRHAPQLLDRPADQRADRPTVAVVFLGDDSRLA